MFTGIIEALGTIERVHSKGKDLVLSIHTGSLDLSDVKLGDSIAVNGVCLTVVSLTANGFTADVSAESLTYTNIASFTAGTRVNLEKALTLATRLGGHLVSGHVDAVGEILARTHDGRSIRFEVSCPSSLKPYIANKGSITVDGVSLTVTGLTDKGFCLNIVPHTAAETTIESFKHGDKVHLEVDLMARYAERILECRTAKDEPEKSGKGIDAAFLAQNGFYK